MVYTRQRLPVSSNMHRYFNCQEWQDTIQCLKPIWRTHTAIVQAIMKCKRIHWHHIASQLKKENVLTMNVTKLIQFVNSEGIIPILSQGVYFDYSDIKKSQMRELAKKVGIPSKLRSGSKIKIFRKLLAFKIGKEEERQKQKFEDANFGQYREFLHLGWNSKSLSRIMKQMRKKINKTNHKRKKKKKRRN